MVRGEDFLGDTRIERSWPSIAICNREIPTPTKRALMQVLFCLARRQKCKEML